MHKRTNGARKRRPRKLLPRQSAWLRHIADPYSPAYGNRAKAAELAGYRPGKPGSNQLAVQGHRLANNPHVQRAMSEILDERGGTLEHCAARLVEASNAQRRKIALAKNGEFVYSDPEPDHSVRVRAVENMVALHGEPRPRSTSAAPNPERGITVTATTPEEQRRLAAAQQAVEQLPASERMQLREAFNRTRAITRKILTAPPDKE